MTIKLRTNVRIPARVASGPGISQVISNGTLTTELDIDSIDPAVSIPDPSSYRIFIYNDATDEWESTTLDNVPTTTTGDAYTGRGDAAYTILSTDRYIELTAALTAARIWTLPAASAVPAGTRMTIHDAAGGITATNTITVGVTGADTINGASTFVINAARAGVEFRSDGSSKWTVGLIFAARFAANSVGDAALRQSAALSVVGRSANSTGNVADITAGTDGYVLTRSGTSLVFGQVQTAGLADAGTTNAKLANMAQATIKGRASGAGTGAPVDLTATEVRTILSTASLGSGTAASASSQTSMDWTGIPAGVKIIDIGLAGISTNGTSAYIVQIGPSGGVETSSYLGTASVLTNATAIDGANMSSGFTVTPVVGGATVVHGVLRLTLIDASTNTWACSGSIGYSNGITTAVNGGSKSLAGTLERVRLTTAGGADTFDAGKANINYIY